MTFRKRGLGVSEGRFNGIVKHKTGFVSLPLNLVKFDSQNVPFGYSLTASKLNSFLFQKELKVSTVYNAGRLLINKG